MFGHEQMQTAIDAICKLVERGGRKSGVGPHKRLMIFAEKSADFASGPLEEAYKLRNKQERSGKIKQVYADTIEQIGASDSGEEDEGTFDENVIGDILHKLESDIVRSRILNGEARIDGRDTRTVRPISIRTGSFPGPTVRHCLPGVRHKL